LGSVPKPCVSANGLIAKKTKIYFVDMGFFRHKCLLKIYIFILKILSFSFERTKENETKENSSQPETPPPAALSNSLAAARYSETLLPN
jgi:hypothetical protein